MKVFWSVFRIITPTWPSLLLAALLGFFTVGSGVGLMATAAFLLSSAALHPPVLDLMPAVVGVRFFGISRAVFRYLERYVAHDAAFRALRPLRVWFYQTLEPLAPARLTGWRSGDLLDRIVADVEILERFPLRVLVPPCVALLVLAGAYSAGFFPGRRSGAALAGAQLKPGGGPAAGGGAGGYKRRPG